MTHEERLLQACQHWHRLSDAERAAVQASNWNALTEAQSRKQLLQRDIDEVLQSVTAIDRQRLVTQFASTVADLVTLERENLATLNWTRDRAVEEKLALDQASLHLRQVRQAYAPSQSNAWHSYS